eukprot:COSAG05_NODE_16096_length_353_cov_1.208661_2_plen_48_part_01
MYPRVQTLLRVRLHIIGNVRIKNVVKHQSCMVSKLPIVRVRVQLISHA